MLTDMSHRHVSRVLMVGRASHQPKTLVLDDLGMRLNNQNLIKCIKLFYI